MIQYLYLLYYTPFRVYEKSNWSKEIDVSRFDGGSVSKFKIGDEVRNVDPTYKTSAIIVDIKDGKYFYEFIKTGYINSWTISELEKNCRKLTKLEQALK